MTIPNTLPNHEAPDVLTEVRGQVGFITLNRPRAHQNGHAGDPHRLFS